MVPVYKGGKKFLVPLRKNPGWSEHVKIIARMHRPFPIFKGPVEATFAFLLRPRANDDHELPDADPDLENLISGLANGLEDEIYCDDNQIVDLHIHKRYARSGTPGVWVTVRTIDDPRTHV